MKTATPSIIEFDIRGQICPATLLTALREINRHAQPLRQGEVALRFLTSNRDSTQTIPESAANMGFNATVTAMDGYYEIAVTGHE